MPDPHERDESATDPALDDPRLRIPEVLRRRPGDNDLGSAGRVGNRGHRPEQPAHSGMAETARAWGMALDLVFTAVGAFALGYLFDLWRGTGPWGALVGLGLGFVTATVRLVRTSLRQEAREQAERRKTKGP